VRPGDLRPFLISASVVEIDGESCVINVGRDITQIRQTEAKLRASEDRFRRIYDADNDILTIIGWESGIFISVNDELVNTLGYDRDEIVGRTNREVAIFRQADVHRFIKCVRENGDVRGFEAPVIAKDGSELSCLVSARLIYLDGEKCCVIRARDISALKDADRRIRKSELTLRTVIESSSDAITIARQSDGALVSANEGFVKMTGFTREQVLGCPVLRLDLWADLAQRDEFFAQLQLVGSVPAFASDLRTKAGQVIPVLTSATVVELSGQPCIVAITRDISLIRTTEQQLVEAKQAALEASQAKSEFLSTISHEIRTPMNAIIGMTQLLERDPLTPRQQQYLDIMRVNSDALLQLINDTLDLARIESRRLKLDPIEFDLRELLEQIRDLMRVRSEEKGLELRMHIEPDIPRHLVGDPLRIRQIIVNLLGNAIKFTERGWVCLGVRRIIEPVNAAAAFDKKQVRLEIVVSDTGIGIAQERLEAVFTSFTQADSSTTRLHGGSGLGLTIVKQLAALHGGDVTVESELGVGSRFTASLSFGLAEYCPSTTSSEKADYRTIERARPSRILVVDDAPVNRLLVREYLAHSPLELEEATNGKEAFEMFSAREYELVLMDMRMPVMDGYSAIKDIRA
jgi:PAS domain S-box-containing protein